MPSIALTDRFVSGVKPAAGKRTDYPDKLAKGLTLRVFPSGVKSWTYRYLLPRDGAAGRVSFGTFPSTGSADARARTMEARNAIEAGKDPRGVFERENGGMTVADLNFIVPRKARPVLRSAAEIERRFNRNVLPVIGQTRLADLHKRDATVSSTPFCDGKARSSEPRLEDVRALIRWGVQRGDLDHSIVEGMKKPYVGAPRERVLSDDEINTLWNGLPHALARSRSVQRIIRLLLATAQRVGEVAGMRKDELDLRARLWRLPGTRTKNAHPHQVPLSDLSLSIIGDALADSGDSPFVFPSGNFSLPGMAVAKCIARGREPDAENPHGRFGVQGWTAHDLRRTALTGMARLGVAPMVLGHVANHRTTTKAGVTFGVYVQHGFQQEKRAALERWGDRLLAIVGDKAAAKVLSLNQQRKRDG